MKFLLMRLNYLRIPYAEIPDGSNIFLYPIEIITNKFILFLTIITKHNIPIITLSYIISQLSKITSFQIKVTKIMLYRYILVEEGIIILDQEYSRLKYLV